MCCTLRGFDSFLETIVGCFRFQEIYRQKEPKEVAFRCMDQLLNDRFLCVFILVLKRGATMESMLRHMTKIFEGIIRLDLELSKFAFARLVGKVARKGDGLKSAVLGGEKTKLSHDSLDMLIALQLIKAINDDHKLVPASPCKFVESVI